MKTNKLSDLTLHEIMSLLDRTRPEGERVDEALPCSEHAIRVMSRILQEQGLTVVDADGLQHVIREVFPEGDCPAVQCRGYPHPFRHREMAWVDH